MHPCASALAATLLAGVLGGAAAVGAIPELALIAQFTAVGGLVGAGLSLYRDRKHGPDGDRRFRIVTVWTIVGTLVGIAALLAGVP